LKIPKINKTLDNRELLKIINDLENTIDISALTFNDLNIWPLIRISVSFGLISQRYNAKTFSNKKNSNNILTTYKNYINYKKFLKKNLTIKALDVTHDLYLHNINNKIYDRVHFGYENNESLNSTKVNRINLSDYTLREIDQNLTQVDFSFIFHCIKIASIPYALFLAIGNLKTYKPLFDIFKFFKSNGINIKSILIKIPFKVSYMLLLSRFMMNFFKRTELKILRHANYYSLDSMALTLAAKKCDILVQHIQHGSQADDHPAFGNWSNVPLEGYELVPNVFNCWNEESVKVLSKSFEPIKNHQIKLSKYHWVDAWKKGEIAYNSSEIKSHADNKYNVLITLQPSINGIQNFVAECIDKSSDDICWWIRLHPRQLTEYSLNNIKKQLPKKTGRVLIDLASNSPLPALLAFCDHHITAFSSSIYEASYFEIPTIITHKMGIDYYGDNLKDLNANYCIDSDSILKILKNGVVNKF